jgi:hypothetical protein
VDAHEVRGSPSLVLKTEVYPVTSLGQRLFSTPRAYREFENLECLQRLGVPVAEPVACGWSGTWPIFKRSFLLAREVEGAHKLKGWTGVGRGEPSHAEMLGLLQDLCARLAEIHRQGWWVRTLQAKNLLWRRRPDGCFELVLIDVPRLTRSRDGRLCFRGAVKDLAFLDKWGRGAFTSQEREGLLRHYLEVLGQGPPARRWMLAIDRVVKRRNHESALGRASHRLRRALRKVGLRAYWPF